MFCVAGSSLESICELAKSIWLSVLCTRHLSVLCTVVQLPGSLSHNISHRVSHGDTGDLLHSWQQNQIRWTAVQLLGAQLCLLMFCI